MQQTSVAASLHTTDQLFADSHDVFLNSIGHFRTSRLGTALSAVSPKAYVDRNAFGYVIQLRTTRLDKIFVFRLDASSGQLIPNDPPWVEAPEGAGPRHIVFHSAKGLAYVVNELNSTVTTYAWNPVRGGLKPLQVLPSTPSDYVGNNRASEIAISESGRHVYVSNRGHDSVGLFSTDSVSGLLSPVEWTPSQGKGPRFFALGPDELHLYAANELTDLIVRFAVDGTAGRLRPTGQTIETGSPVCIAFIVPNAQSVERRGFK